MFKIIAAATLLGGLPAIVATSSPPTTSSPSFDRQTRTDSTRSYVLPRPFGERVSFCLANSSKCGKPAADAFCRGVGFREALTFQRNGMQRDLSSNFHQIKCWLPIGEVDRND